jgi:hypothetical protein
MNRAPSALEQHYPSGAAHLAPFVADGRQFSPARPESLVARRMPRLVVGASRYVRRKPGSPGDVDSPARKACWNPTMMEPVTISGAQLPLWTPALMPPMPTCPRRPPPSARRRDHA